MKAFLKNKFVCYLWAQAWQDYIGEGWTVTKICGWNSARVKSKSGRVLWIQLVVEFE